MQFQEWTEECRFLLDWHEQLLGDLKDAIIRGSGFACIRQWPHPAFTGKEARAKISDRLGEIYRKDDNEEYEDRLCPVFAAVNIDPEGLKTARKLNIVKTEFKEFHERLRGCFSTTKEATDALRVVINHCGHARLNVEAVDRQVPCVDQPVNRISWHYNRSDVSRRRTIADAIAELRVLQDKMGEIHHDRYEAEIRDLERRDPTEPVAHKLRKRTVKSLRIAYSYRDETGQLCREIGYGRNPIMLACPERQLAPILNLPREFCDDTVKDGRGRKRIISERIVSPSLSRWFFYDERPPEKATRPSRSQNTAAKTAFPGIWFALSPRKKPVLGYTKRNGSKTTRSIARYGLEEAWRMAVSELPGNLTDQQREDLLKHTPSDEDLQRFLDSHKTTN